MDQKSRQTSKNGAFWPFLIFWRKIAKIENPRQSFDKESIERGDFFDRIKKSSIAEEKKILEDRPPSKTCTPPPSKGGARLLAPPLDSADSLLAPNHQNPGSELESSKPVQVACLVW